MSFNATLNYTVRMKNTRNDELAVCGFAAVKSLEKANWERIKRLYFTQERAPLFGGLCRKLAGAKKPYNQVKDESELERLSGSVHHQGVVAMIEPPVILPLNTSITANWIATGQSAILLDRVGNANNIGAIVRSAAFFGIQNIVIPFDCAQTAVTTSSYRVAEGGMEFVSLYSVKSIPRLLEDMAGKMERIGTALDGTKSSRDIPSLCRNKPAILILGNEENGISAEVRKNCDHLVLIPFAKDSEGKSKVDSLNVAQAASVLMYELSFSGADK